IKKGEYSIEFTANELLDQIKRLLQHPNLASKTWVTNQYDHYVQGNTALAMPDNAGVVRVDEESGLGVALATDSNSRFAKLNPRQGAVLSLVEAYLNVACTGSNPLAITDCLNFSNPEKPELMWQLVEAIEGLADACYQLEVPVTGGNVSLYNATGTEAINPVPSCGVLGVIQDVKNAAPSCFMNPDKSIYLIGETKEELDGSVYADVMHNSLGGQPPVVDLTIIQKTKDILIDLINSKVIEGVHDLSQGGLAASLFEACSRIGVGCSVDLAKVNKNNVFALFSESAGRVLVESVDDVSVEEKLSNSGIPFVKIGQTTSGNDLYFENIGSLNIQELKELNNKVIEGFLQ
ncbi:MAG: hypothetical protein LBM13_03580, partial [Candidatus Ancillula sp.]|nr:hypothetical protein [Candidatus Ancillula sp.]